MRQIGIIDYIKSKSKSKIPFWSKRLKEFVQIHSDSELKSDDEYNEASLQILKQEHDVIHQMLLDYFQMMLKQDFLPGTIHMLFSAFRGWLTANRYIIDPIELKELKSLLPKNVIVTEDDFLNIDKIRSIIAQSDSMLRAFILIACSSGARIGEILAIENDSIKYWEDEDVYFFKVSHLVAKTGKPHRYYISHEAYKEVCEYRKNWKQYQDRRVAKSYKSLGIKVKNTNLLFQINASGVREKLTRTLQKAGLHDRDDVSGRTTIHPHSFRKFADTVFKEHLGVNMGNELIGHDEGLSTSYRRYDPKAVAEAYRKVEPFVTILAPSDYVEIKEKVSEEVEKIRAGLAAQSIEMIEIKERLQETEELLSITLGNRRTK